MGVAAARPNTMVQTMDELLRVSVWALGSCVILALLGEWVEGAAARVREVLALLIESGVRRVAVDLSGLWSADSQLLDAVREAADKLAKQGGSLVLAAPQRSVALILDLSGISRCIPVYPSVAEAAAR